MKQKEIKITEPICLYHITKKEYLDSILKNGLEPRIGENSKMVNEHKPMICLCDEKSIPYWRILLDHSAIVKVNVDLSKLKKYSYSFYNEFVSNDKIEPSNITIANCGEPKDIHMKDLCASYIYSLSGLTTYAARHYTYSKNEESKKFLGTMLDSFIAVKDRLDFSVMSDAEKSLALTDFGESGEYTFLDTYMNQEIKLYEKLIDYPEDDLSEKRKIVCEYIKTTFHGCLDLNTGGWTG